MQETDYIRQKLLLPKNPHLRYNKPIQLNTFKRRLPHWITFTTRIHPYATPSSPKTAWSPHRSRSPHKPALKSCAGEATRLTLQSQLQPHSQSSNPRQTASAA